LVALWIFALPAQAAQPPAGYAKAADGVIKAYVDPGVFSGAVLVAKDGKPVFRKAFGLADREWDVANTPQTRFRLGSITKQFTAAAILQLAEQGKLSVDDPISKYYPAAPAAWAPITLKHLLTHTSGIPSYTAIPGFFAQQARLDKTPDEIIALTRDKPLEFPPGSKYAYDNTGYILLGYVVEKVSGQSYAAYLQEHIFGPLGMKDSGYDVSTTILSRRAAGYSLIGGKARNAAFLSMTVPYAAGSLYSTVDDLLIWDQALHAGKAIKPASVAAMFTDYGFNYGFGQGMGTVNGHRTWGHGGGINGFATQLNRLPDDGLTVVVLGNVEQAPSGRIAQKLADIYFDPSSAAGAGVKPTIAEMDRYIGRYRMSPALVIDVTRDGQRLFAQATNQPKVELYREAGRTYFVTVAPLSMTFAEGDHAPEISVRQGGKDTIAKRID
jgi:CubicO group peptidase (beta-lactamase class C family)